MGEDFQSAPVPIRLTCRYSNGTVVSYGARALAYDDSSLRVLSSEGFEKGISLNVLAPFLGGIASCRVAGASRSSQQPGYFELQLKFLKKPLPAAQQMKEAPQASARKGVPEDLARAAEELAERLESARGQLFSEVLKRAPASPRPLFLLVSAAAVLLLLQEKGLLDARHVLETVRRKERT